MDKADFVKNNFFRRLFEIIWRSYACRFYKIGL
jgi:hypothetical protein